MRMRFKPYAHDELMAADFHVHEPLIWGGKWHAQYARPEQPFVLELGCGKGGFLSQLACAHPENNYLGIDITDKVLILAKRKIEAAYQEAVNLVLPVALSSREEQLTYIAAALRERFDSGMSYSMDADHYNDPYGYFVLGSASCAGCTRATGLCLNVLGIPYEHVNENQYSHQWCRVPVGDTYWICDAYGLYCGPEPAPYQHPYL